MTLLFSSLALSVGQPTLSWNLVADLQDMLRYPFMLHTFAAGTIVAIIAGALGYFVVLRGMAFASHTLANIGFAGAAGAALVGVNPVFGLLAFTFVGALGMGALGRRIYGRDVAVGIVLAVALALGLLFINLYHGGYGINTYSILFGDVLSVSAQDVVIALAVGALTLVALASVWRPLLFASLDEEVAEARGLPVRWLALGFLLLLGLVVAEAVQIVGVLLIFALLVTPAAIAERLTRRPGRALLLAVAIALIVTWASIFIAYYYPYPLGFFISTLAFALYLLTRIGEIGARWMQRRRPGASVGDGAPAIVPLVSRPARDAARPGGAPNADALATPLAPQANEQLEGGVA